MSGLWILISPILGALGRLKFARGAKGRRYKVSCLVHLCTRLRSSDSPNGISPTSARSPSISPTLRASALAIRCISYMLGAGVTFVPVYLKGVASRVKEHDIRSRVDAPREVEYVALWCGTVFFQLGQALNGLKYAYTAARVDSLRSNNPQQMYFILFPCLCEEVSKYALQYSTRFCGSGNILRGKVTWFHFRRQNVMRLINSIRVI